MARFYVSFCCILLFCWSPSAAQHPGLVSGPWAGNIEMRTASIWAEVKPSVRSVSVDYFPLGKPKEKKTVRYVGELGRDFNPVKFNLTYLQFNTTYSYTLLIDGKEVKTAFPTQFTTKDLWQYRKPAPDFNFLAGSCAYFNEPEFDRPGKPYGYDSTIFATMAREDAAFHIWMGDNWYTREADYTSAWGMNYRASRDRSLPILQPFMAKMPQYAIWDDHDFGPNDAGRNFLLRQESRDIFKQYSLQQAYGENGEGIYSSFGWSDVDFFLTDDRYFRSHDDMPDSINGQPNSAKTFFGARQMDWLKNALLYSRATFKVIVVGSQVLNPLNRFECFRHYPYEFNDLMQFLDSQRINGVIFFTGDRHHSEVIGIPRPGQYPLYDVTISPYTAGISKASGTETNNPFRMPNTLVETHNYGRISVSGPKGKREMKVEFIGLRGDKLGEWSVNEESLKKPAQ